MSDKVYVKTEYDHNSNRKPDISEYDSKEEAEEFVSICMKWGVGIAGCKIVPILATEPPKQARTGNSELLWELQWAIGQFQGIRAYTQDGKTAAACADAEDRLKRRI